VSADAGSGSRGERLDRKRSQIFGIGILVLLVLLIACIRYYFGLG